MNRTLVATILTLVSLPIVLCGGCTATVAWSLYSGFSSTTKSANEFLEHVAAGRIEAAYNATAPTIQNVFTLPKFAEKMEVMGLTNARLTNWNHISLDYTKKSAKLEGCVEHASAGKCKITMTLVRIQDTWKVESILLGDKAREPQAHVRAHESNRKDLPVST